MDPGNAEYRQAVAQMESQANGRLRAEGAVGMNTLDCGAFWPMHGADGHLRRLRAVYLLLLITF